MLCGFHQPKSAPRYSGLASPRAVVTDLGAASIRATEFAFLPGASDRRVREKGRDLCLDDRTGDRVSRSGAGNDFVQAVTARRHGRKRLDEMRIERSTVVHQSQPCMKIACLAKRMVAFQAKLSREQWRINCSHTKRHDRAGIAEYGVLKAFGKLRNVLVRSD